MPTTSLSTRHVPAAAARAEAERHWRSGVAHARSGRWRDAEKAHARAARLAPQEPLHWINLGHARRKLGDLDGTLAAAERALALAPDAELAIRLRLSARLERHAHGEAIDDARRIAARPDAGYADWLDCGVALAGAGRHLEAISALMRALALRPDGFDAYVALCNAFDRLGLHAEAVETLRTAIALRPEWGQALGGIVYHALYACDWSRLETDLAALHAVLRRPGPHDFGPFMFLSAGTDAATQRRVFADHAAQHFGHVVALPAPVPPRGAASGRVRVGYLSSDFHHHATATLLAQVIERHDRGSVEVRLYSHSTDDDSPLRRRLQAGCDAFVDVSRMGDDEAARRIRDDRVEILVDLKGWTLGARTGIVARRPAPVQVAWLGFPGTSGAPFVDYAIVDPVVMPPDRCHEFSEKLAWLPDCYQPNDRSRAVGPAPGRVACGLPEDALVLCSFNHTYKIRPEVFDRWCAVLRAVPDAVLWLLESNPRARTNLLREAGARGIAAGRVVFAPLAAADVHLARLSHADLVLDTLPVNAHTTASDALWAGVPVVTCVGEAFAGRVAASLLAAVGLSELVTPDLDAYEALVRALAGDRARLAALRERLRAARDHAPLFDSARTARELDALFGRMAERWRAGLAPEHLPPRDAGVAHGRADAGAPR